MNKLNKVLVTGSRGFVGTALCARLKANEMDVVEWDLPQRDVSEKFSALSGVSRVYHLAAKSFVPDSIKMPVEFFRANVMGTLNALEFCREARTALTYVSAYVYGRPNSLPISESSPRLALNPYTQSKILAEDLCDFYHRQYGVPITIIRPFNVFGPGQRGEFLIPTVINQVLDSKIDVVEVADLRPKRDFIYVDDLVDALLLTQGRVGYEVFNIGQGVSYSVKEVVETILAETKSSKTYRETGPVRSGEILDLYANISLAKDGLGWAPKVGFASGIGRILRASHL